MHNWEVTVQARLLQTHSHLPPLSICCPARPLGVPRGLYSPLNFPLRKNCADSFLLPHPTANLDSSHHPGACGIRVAPFQVDFLKRDGCSHHKPGASPAAYWRNRRPPMGRTSGTAPELPAYASENSHGLHNNPLPSERADLSHL